MDYGIDRMALSESLARLKRHGFREVGRHERLGRMRYGPLAGVRRDVVLMERRSPVDGAE
jgi:L-amino acid N-acyltransferase YncA